MKSFFVDESGMETIEFVVILAIIAGLIALVTSIGKKVTKVGNGAAVDINDGMTGLKEADANPLAGN